MPKSPATRKEQPVARMAQALKKRPVTSEGCERRWCINTEEAIGRRRRVKAPAASKWNGSATRTAECPSAPVAGSEFVPQAISLLLAMGFYGPCHFRKS